MTAQATSAPRCTIGAHVGPLVGTERYEQHPETHWRDYGECAHCGSTVHQDHIVSTPELLEAA